MLLDRVSPRPSEGSSWSVLPQLCCAHDKTVYAWTSDPLVRLYSGRKHLLLLARIPVEHTINDSLSNGRKVEPDAVVVPSSSFQLSPGSSGFIAMCSVEPYTMEPPKYEVMTLICFLCTLLCPSKREEAPVPHAALERVKGRQVLLIRRSLLDTGMGKHGASLWHNYVVTTLCRHNWTAWLHLRCQTLHVTGRPWRYIEITVQKLFKLHQHQSESIVTS